MKSQLLSYFYLVGVLTSLISGTILVFYRRLSFYKRNAFLGIHFIFLSLALLVAFLYHSDLILHAPHLYRLGFLFVYIGFPFSYFYIRSVLKDSATGNMDLLFFLPLLFYLIDFAPFFIKSADEKLMIIEAHKSGALPALSFAEGWVTPPKFQVFLKQLFIFIIWFFQLRLVANVKPDSGLLTDNRSWYDWIRFYQFQQAFYWLPSIIFIAMIPGNQIRLYTEIIPIVFLVLIQFYLLYNPSVLYGTQGFLKMSIKNPEEADPKSLPSEEQLDETLHKLESCMKQSRAFMKQGYALYNLSDDIGVRPRLVSKTLNYRLNSSFNEYINNHRIDYFIELIESGAHKTRTIEALAKESGFTNRSSFIRAFKKYKDATPKEFIKNFSMD